MSWEATAYVKGLTVDPDGVPITRTEKMVLFVLSDCINPYTGQGWVTGGLDALAQDALISRRGLLYTLDRLQERKVLAKISQASQSGRTRSNVYVFLQMQLKACKGATALPLKLPINEPKKDGYAQDLEGEARVHPGVQPDCTLQGAIATAPPLPLNSVLKDFKTPPTGSPPQEGSGVCLGQAEEVLAELNRLTGMHFKARHPNGALTANGRLVLAALGKGYTVDQLVRVIRLKHKGWWGGEMQKYLRPKTLFAAENFDQYVAGLSDKVGAGTARVLPVGAPSTNGQGQGAPLRAQSGQAPAPPGQVQTAGKSPTSGAAP